MRMAAVMGVMFAKSSVITFTFVKSSVITSKAHLCLGAQSLTAKLILAMKYTNLVDPASSHLRVSKIKPCMSQYDSFYDEGAYGSLSSYILFDDHFLHGYLWQFVVHCPLLLLLLEMRVWDMEAWVRMAAFMGVMCGPSLSTCLLYTSPSPRDKRQSRMPSSA